MKIRARVILAAAAVLCTVASYGQKRSGNPIFEGRYADPEGVVFGNTYWIYPTYSAPFDDQLFFDAFSSKDLVKWTKHERIIDSSRIKWLRRALWAPAAIEKDGKYYLFFGANDVHEGEIGGIGVAVADNPAGPFEDYLGKPLIGEIINGAQPIDQFVFKDKDGTLYMYYGGWTCAGSSPSTTASPSRRLRPRVMSRVRSCSSATASITSCGRRAAGQAPTTVWRMPCRTTRWVHSCVRA